MNEMQQQLNQLGHELQVEPPRKKPPTPKQPPIMLMVMGAICIIFGLWLADVYLRKNEQNAHIQVLTRESVVMKIQSLNRLQTVAYNIDTVIQSQKEGNWYTLWQDGQKGLFVAHGRVSAGIDLNQLTVEQVDVSEDGQQVMITLPSAQIFETTLDKIEVYDIKTGLFGMVSLDPKLFNVAQEEGKKQVFQSACKSRILDVATENAQKQVKALFELAEVQVEIATSPAVDCT